MKRRFFFLGAVCLALCTLPPVHPAETTATGLKVREPAVAGLFYPADPAELSRVIDRHLAAARGPAVPGRLRALICPHAGYVYSGPVAASGFRLLQGLSFDTVVLLAPSHYAYLQAASVSGADVFRTPLGDVRISPRARELARLRPFELEPACFVQRPDWAAQSSRRPPADGRETADTWEHSDEVEVPFLQKTLGDFQLVPVVLGEVDPRAAAQALDRILDGKTLVVVSSDLSHYHASAEANRLDRRCIDAICRLDVGQMEKEEACGRTPILTLLHLARQHGWQARLLDHRNSGDTAGSQERVVGYAAIALYEPAPKEAGLTPDERRQLLGLARRTLREAAASGRLPDETGAGVPANLAVPRACFVTLTRAGELRGCIGHLEPQMPLWRAVLDNARSAALRDPRFPPVTPREVDRIEIEISVLTKPEPLAFDSPDDLLRKLHPGRDGVVLQLGGARATFLPQVWEQLPDKVGFLDHLAVKAGGDANDWRKPGTTVFIYHVESFKESDFAGK